MTLGLCKHRNLQARGCGGRGSVDPKWRRLAAL